MRWFKILALVAFVATVVPAGSGCVTRTSASQPKKARSCPYRRNSKRRVPYKRGPMKR